MNSLTIDKVTVVYNETQVLHNLSFTLEVGKSLAIIGASGSGKTTLLRAIAGLQTRSTGNICFNELRVEQPENRLIPGMPDIQLVTQDFELLPMLSAYEHIFQSAYGWEEEKKEKITLRLLQVFGLKKEAHRPVRNLSGGQQQRVALAKKLATNASLYLFDEAFSQLDLASRAEVMRKVKAYIERNKKTALFVVHDPMDAFYLADNMLVLSNGRIAQKGLATEVVAKPRSLAVAKLFGITNALPTERAKAWFPNNIFHTIGKKAIFQPYQVRLQDVKLPFEVIDEIATPRGKLLQLRIESYKIWVES